MRKSKFSEHQILAILKAVEAGRPVMKYSGQKTLATESSRFRQRCRAPAYDSDERRTTR
jgi:hypothetical protein